MYRSLACLIALLSLAPAPCVNAEPLRLSVDEAVARATTANLEFSATRKDVDVAQANLERSKAWLPSNPYLTGGAQHAGGFGPNYSFLLSQEFEVAGQRNRRMASAAEEVERANWDVTHAQMNLAATVKTAYLHALITAQRVTLAQQSVDATADFAKRLADRSHLSDTERFDLNTALVQEAHTRRALAAAERERDGALLSLRRLIGLPLDQELELTGAPESSIRTLPPAAELIERAMRQRADLIALRHAMQRGDMQIATAQREAIPNVTLSGTVSRFEGDTLAGGEIGVPIPLFNGKHAEVQEATAERDRAGLQKQHLEREVEKEVVEALQSCAVAAGDVEAFRRVIVPKNEENLQLERRLYDRDEISLADLIGVEVDAVTARREQLDAVEAYNTSLIELDRVTGAR